MGPREARELVGRVDVRQAFGLKRIEGRSVHRVGGGVGEVLRLDLHNGTKGWTPMECRRLIVN